MPLDLLSILIGYALATVSIVSGMCLYRRSSLGKPVIPAPRFRRVTEDDETPIHKPRMGDYPL